MAQQIHELQITPAGTEGFKKAEVTAGGVAMQQHINDLLRALIAEKLTEFLLVIGDAVFFDQ